MTSINLSAWILLFVNWRKELLSPPQFFTLPEDKTLQKITKDWTKSLIWHVHFNNDNFNYNQGNGERIFMELISFRIQQMKQKSNVLEYWILFHSHQGFFLRNDPLFTARHVEEPTYGENVTQNSYSIFVMK